jgi:malonyl-CoA O-methyltransferase
MKQKIAYSFSKAAKYYEDNAEVQKYCAKNLVKIANQYTSPEAKILDIGSGTGFISKEISKKIYHLDFAEKMCKKTKDLGHTICADFEKMPIKENSFDCVFSASAIQWNENLEAVFSGVYKILKENGYFFIATYGENTLKELKTIYKKNNLEMTILDFKKSSRVREKLIKCGFKIEKFKQEKRKIYIVNIISLFQRVKVIGAGASNKSNKFSKKLLTKMNDDYLKKFGKKGEIYSTWEIYYFICKKSS